MNEPYKCSHGSLWVAVQFSTFRLELQYGINAMLKFVSYQTCVFLFSIQLYLLNNKTAVCKNVYPFFSSLFHSSFCLLVDRGLWFTKDLWPIKWVDNSLFFSVLLTTIMELAVKLCTLTKWQQAETPYTMEVLNLFPHKGKSISDISSTTSPHQAHLDSLPCQTDIEIIRVFHLPDTLGHKMALCVVMAGVLLSLSASGRLPVTALRPVCY